MRTAFFLALFFAALSPVLAQTEKGRWLVGGGGTAYFDTGNDNYKQTIVLFAPAAGAFVSNNVVVGAMLPFIHARTKTTGTFTGGTYHSTTVGLTPFARFYFGQSNVKPYLQGQFGVLSSSANSSPGGSVSPSSASSGVFTYGATAGLAFFLNEHSSFDIQANYTGGNKNSDFSGILLVGTYPRTFALNVGFHLFLGKAK
jgi:outer membrane protein